MSLLNKFKESEESLQNNASYFNNFMMALKEHREHRPMAASLRRSRIDSIEQPSHSGLSAPHHADSPIHLSKDLLSSPPQSFASSHLATSVKVPLNGDACLSHRGRYGAGRRGSQRHQIPSHCFQPSRNQLSEYLRQLKPAPQNESRIFEQSSQDKSYVQRERIGFESQMSLLRGSERVTKIVQFNERILLKYCSLNKLSRDQPPNQIHLFFTRLLDMCNFHLPDPTIQKYSNCVYYGQKPRDRHVYEGVLYFYDEVIYYGQLYRSEKHGNGVEIDLSRRVIYKGEWKDGKMVGPFSVTKDGEYYEGQVSKGHYHGQGRLMDSSGVIEGEFKYGKPSKILRQSRSKEQQSKSSRKQQSNQEEYYNRYPVGQSQTQYLDLSQKLPQGKPKRNSRGPSQVEAFWQGQQPMESDQRQQKRRLQGVSQFSYAFDNDMVHNPELLAHPPRTSKGTSMRIRPSAGRVTREHPRGLREEGLSAESPLVR